VSRDILACQPGRRLRSELTQKQMISSDTEIADFI